MSPSVALVDPYSDLIVFNKKTDHLEGGRGRTDSRAEGVNGLPHERMGGRTSARMNERTKVQTDERPCNLFLIRMRTNN